MSDKIDQFHLFNIGECKNCNKPYSNPYILNCLHTFCYDCIKNMSNEIDPKCRTCKEKFELQSDGMPLHYSNRSFEDLAIVKSLMSKLKPDSLCDLCKKQKATNFCRECKIIICPHDARTHVKATKDEHEMFKLEVLREYDNIFKLIPENTMNYCKQHPEKLIQFYCYRCNVVLCTECAHGGHMEDPCYANEMNSMFQGRRKMVTERQIEEKLKIDDIDSQNVRIRSMIEEISKHEEELLKKINYDFDEHINLLKMRQNELNNTIRTVFANRRAELDKIIDTQKDFARESRHLLEMTSFFLNELPGTHLFPPAVALCNKMDKLERIRANIITDFNPFEFNFSKDTQYVNDPQRIGKLTFRFPLGFESPRYSVDLNSKMKLPFDFKITGMGMTSNGDMQLLLHDSQKQKNCKSNIILRLNNSYQPLQNNKWLEPMASLDEYTNISHFNVTPEGTTILVDRNLKQFQAISNGRLNCSVSGDVSSGLSTMLDPYNVIGRKCEGFIIYNKESNTIEIYTSCGKLENQFEVSPKARLPVPSTPTTNKRVNYGGSTPEPSSEHFGGFISFTPQPPKFVDPVSTKHHQPSTNLQIACNSFGEIYYVFDNKPVIKRFSEKGEELKEFKFAEIKVEASKVSSNSKVPVTTKANTPFERTPTIRKGKTVATKPNTLTIPTSNPTPLKQKSFRTLLTIDHFNNVYVYQSGHIYILNMSLDSVQTRGKINFEPDFMMVSEMGHIILASRNDTMIRVF